LESQFTAEIGLCTAADSADAICHQIFFSMLY
jgi:hypothetical protein